MLLKLNLSLSLDLLSPVANKHLIGENIGPLFASIFLVLHSLNSLHTRARCTFKHAHFYWCISALWPVVYKQPYHFFKFFGDHNSWSWPHSFFLFPDIMGNPPCSACHQLAAPAGCPQTLERYQADRASILAAKTQQMHHTEDNITKSGDLHL